MITAIPCVRLPLDHNYRMNCQLAFFIFRQVVLGDLPSIMLVDIHGGGTYGATYTSL